LKGRKRNNEELCALRVFRETWKLLNSVEDLNEAKEKFKTLVINLIFGE